MQSFSEAFGKQIIVDNASQVIFLCISRVSHTLEEYNNVQVTRFQGFKSMFYNIVKLFGSELLPTGNDSTKLSHIFWAVISFKPTATYATHHSVLIWINKMKHHSYFAHTALEQNSVWHWNLSYIQINPTYFFLLILSFFNFFIHLYIFCRGEGISIC